MPPRGIADGVDCYGVPYIPEGQWLCRKCTVSPENPVVSTATIFLRDYDRSTNRQSCIFCPNEGGAFKQTTTGHWSHLLCAIWIPELTVGNAIYMEPVQDVEQLPKSRWKLVSPIPSRGCCDTRSLTELFIMSRESRSLYSVRQQDLLFRVSRHMRQASGSIDDHEDPRHRRCPSSLLRQASPSESSNLFAWRRVG